MAIEPTIPPNSTDDEVSVREIVDNVKSWIGYLWSNWVFLLIAGVLGGAVGFLYAFLKVPQFTATTTFVLESGDGKMGLGQYSGMAAMVGIDLGGNTSGLFQGDNILELYKSRTMLAQTLLSPTFPDSKELLIERYIKYNGILDRWEKEPDLLALNFRQDVSELSSKSLRTRDSVITSFVSAIKDNSLNVDKPDKKLSIIRVEVTSPDEVFSKSFNEHLVRRVNDFYIQTKIKKSSESIAILQQKVDSVRNVMTGAIYSAARVSDATPNLNPTRQIQRLAPAQEAQFSAEANKAMLTQLLQNLELTKMAMLQEQPLIQLVDEPVYPLKVDIVGKVKSVVFGGFLVGFFVFLFLICLKWYKDVMNEE